MRTAPRRAVAVREEILGRPGLASSRSSEHLTVSALSRLSRIVTRTVSAACTATRSRRCHGIPDRDAHRQRPLTAWIRDGATAALSRSTPDRDTHRQRRLDGMNP